MEGFCVLCKVFVVLEVIFIVCLIMSALRFSIFFGYLCFVGKFRVGGFFFRCESVGYLLRRRVLVCNLL